MIWVFIAGAVIFILAAMGNGYALKTAKAAYDKNLSDLASDPANGRLRKLTLETGRAYANLTRNKKGVTIFDEVALMNDINAACGSSISSTQPNLVSAMAVANPSMQDRLKRLENLRVEGFLSDIEYASKREQILSEL